MSCRPELRTRCLFAARKDERLVRTVLVVRPQSRKMQSRIPNKQSRASKTSETALQAAVGESPTAERDYQEVASRARAEGMGHQLREEFEATTDQCVAGEGGGRHGQRIDRCMAEQSAGDLVQCILHAKCGIARRHPLSRSAPRGWLYSQRLGQCL